MSAITLLQRLRSAPDDPELQREAVDLLFADPVAVSQLLNHFPALEATTSHIAMRRSLAAAPSVSRQEWHNYVSTEVSHPFRISRPQTLAELRVILSEAAVLGYPVRAVGSAHAWSDAAITDGIVIETAELSAVLPLDPAMLVDPASANSLAHVEAGITIHELNTLLDQQNRALINMGGYDGQTLAGVISTSTHGSGLQLGSFPSFVKALVVVAANGDVLQIEPQNGISDPAGFQQVFGGERTLVQDDGLFNACVVGIGCLGVIYAVVLAVMPKYWLREIRRLARWTDVRNDLKNGGLIDSARHVEVLINPHKVDGEHSCLVTTRKIVPEPPQPDQRPFRDLFADFLASLPGTDRVLAFMFNEFPTTSPQLINRALSDLENTGGYTNLSYKVLNAGVANGFRAISAEWGIDLPLQVDAVDALLAAAGRYEAAHIYHSGPIALRYVAASPGFLSMQPVPTCMIEAPMLRDVFGVDEILWRYEQLLTHQFKARPHWGQRNFLTGSRDMIRQLYPKLPDWLGVFNTFNQDQRFTSRFTDRVGFSTHAPVP